MTRTADLVWNDRRMADRIDTRDLKILDVRVGEAYAMGHLPEARHFSVYGINTYDTDDAPLQSFTTMWAFLVGLRGITRDDPVVVYDDVSGMSAARAFWCLEYLGHADVHLLDGGLSAWHHAGRPVTRDAAPPRPATFQPEVARDRVATRHDVIEAIDRPDTVILDARSTDEWLGRDRRAARGGTIPGAVHLEWLNHLTPEGTLLPADELRRRFESLGIRPEKQIIAFCNTGYRSAHAYLVLRTLGYPRVRNYVGSWQEWGNRDECPVVTPSA